MRRAVLRAPGAGAALRAPRVLRARCGRGRGGFAGARGGAGGSFGTVQSVNGDTIVLTEASGNTVKVRLSSSTKVTKTESVKRSAVRPGDTVIVAGAPNSKGTLVAATLTDAGSGGASTRRLGRHRLGLRWLGLGRQLAVLGRRRMTTSTSNKEGAQMKATRTRIAALMAMAVIGVARARRLRLELDVVELLVTAAQPRRRGAGGAGWRGELGRPRQADRLPEAARRHAAHAAGRRALGHRHDRRRRHAAHGGGYGGGGTGQRRGFFGGGGGAGGRFNNPKFRAAFQACGGAAGFRGGAGAPDGFRPTQAAITKFAACAKQHGYTLPKANLTGKGPIYPTSIEKNAKFQAAAKACQSLLRPAGGGALPAARPPAAAPRRPAVPEARHVR